MDYNIERENNIIKNIAREIVNECTQVGLEVPQELAHYVVKLKLLNPKSGFTASEVMPRNQIQQLVTLVVEDLKLDTPGMNCIRMQVYWDTIKINLAELKKKHATLMADKVEPLVNEIITLAVEDSMRLQKLVAIYVLVGYNLGNWHRSLAMKETRAAVRSVLTRKEVTQFFNYSEDQKIDKLAQYTRVIAGVRLYLKYLGKAGEDVQDVNELMTKIEDLKYEMGSYMLNLMTRVEKIQRAINAVVPMDFFMDVSGIPQKVENLPPECDKNDLMHLKKILAIMVQHSLYISDLMSKLDEMDGDAYLILKEFDETLLRLKTTIRDRDAVPTTDVFNDFEKASKFWMEIQAYLYCFDEIQKVRQNLESINKKEYFNETILEKALNLPAEHGGGNRRKKSISSIILSQGTASSAMLRRESEDFQLEFNGYCAWTLFYGAGLLVPGNIDNWINQYKDKYYTFATKFGLELWKRDPEYCLHEIYEYLRENPELVGLLNAYENLYNTKFSEKVKTVERKIATRSDSAQTVLHPVTKFWVKDYTFNLWELRKRALAMSRMVKCVTKSVQTESPHSIFRASIGLLAAPDKDKEVQTMRESYCNHPTIANYLYGLRGHKEDKFTVIELTRPVEENCERVITLEKKDPCRQGREKKTSLEPFLTEPCPHPPSGDQSDYCYEETTYTDGYNT